MSKSFLTRLLYARRNPVSPRNRVSRFVPIVERLGDRVLLACSTSFSGGTLVVNCDAASDNIAFSNSNGRILINGGAVAGGPTVTNTGQIRVFANGGNDVINMSQLSGWGGAATIFGGADDDRMIDSPSASHRFEGGDGEDVFSGGFGNDIFIGGPGTDRIVESFNTSMRVSNGMLTGLGTDLHSGIEGVSLVGGAGDNFFSAAPFGGSATILGGAGDDTIIGGLGRDHLFGNSGDDVITGGPSNDRIIADTGFDRLVETADSHLRLSNFTFSGNGTDAISGFEEARLTGGPGNNTIYTTLFSGRVTANGSFGNDTLAGGTNSDLLQGADGDDRFVTPTGNDVWQGGIGNDMLTVTVNGNLTLTGNGLFGALNIQMNSVEEAQLRVGTDGSVVFNASNFGGPVTMVGGLGADSLIGGPGDDSISGNGGDDSLIGNAGQDTVRGDAGLDTIRVGAGADFFDGGTGFDLINSFELLPPPPRPIDPILTNESFFDGRETDTLNSIESAFLNVNGGIFDAREFTGPVTLLGTAAPETLYGGSSDDSILGGGGDDTIVGGAGFDRLFGDDGNDNIDGGSGDDFIDGGFGTDTANGGEGTDTIVNCEFATQ